jgi:hypothetical protein
MEAASRPPLELLPDPPAEAPAGAARKEPSAPSVAAAPAMPAVAAPSADTGQTGLNFVDPEMFLAAGEQASAVPVGNTGSAAPKATDSSLELVLEDPVVDEVLTAPPPPPAPVTPAAKPAPSTKAPAESASNPAALRAAARVPLARTASLAAAATKLAAASAANQRSSAKPKATPAATAAPSARTATTSAASTATAAPAHSPKAAAQPAAKVEAPSLASWASARAAAAAPKPAASVSAAPASATPAPIRSTPPKSAPSAYRPPAAPAAPAPAPPAAPAAASAATPPTSPLPAAPTMDRDFVARNQIVERYLSGRLPIKSATEFERFCRDHPELLDEIGLPEKVNAGLRLLEAAGKPEPWQEAPRPAWQRPQVTLALAVAAAVLGMALAVVGGGSAGKSHKIADLQKQASERALDPATSTREIRVLPSRSGASNSPAITIGGVGVTQLADMKIDESRSPYHVFRVTVDRIDQGRVGIINNLGKDSNGHLRIALNTSALGPGNYLFTLEGLDWRGAPQPDSWVTIGIQH